MSAAGGALPGRLPLTGTDWFMLAFDRAMRDASASTTCRLVVRADVDVDRVRAALASDEAWGWLRSLRLDAGLGRLPAWRPTVAPGEALAVVDRGALPSVEAVAELAPRLAEGGPLVRLDAVRSPEGALLVLSWHHALLDARGAETLLRRLGGDAEVADVELAPEPEAASPLPERLLRARDARDFLFDVSAGRVGRIVEAPPRDGASPRFRLLALTEEETARSDRRAAEVGAHVVRSALALAAVARAVRGLRARRGLPAADLLVPVPQDQRKRGAQGPVVGNRIGTFFYRLSDAELADPRTAVAAVTDQLRAMMRDRWQQTYTELLALCRHLPLGFYWKVVSGPTEGAVATFGFSDTGETLGRLTTLFGAPVTGAAHLPANLHPPGFTVITSRVRGRLQVTTSWLDGALDDAEIAAFEADLRAELLGPGV